MNELSSINSFLVNLKSDDLVRTICYGYKKVDNGSNFRKDSNKSYQILTIYSTISGNLFLNDCLLFISLYAEQRGAFFV